jgi:hypothetical protein
MQPRRSLRLLAGALVLAVPLLGSCGFDKATDRVYTPAAGTNNRDTDVDVLSAVIVAAQPDSGTFIASLSNTLTKADDTQTLTGLTGTIDGKDVTVTPSDLSVAVPPRGFVNLVDEDPITVSGTFEAGQVAELTLTFDSGDSVSMDVPVVYACNAYEGLDSSQQEPSASGSPTSEPSPGDVPTEGDTATTTTSATTSPTESPSGAVSESSTDSASPSAGSSGAGEPYDCVAVGED